MKQITILLLMLLVQQTVVFSQGCLPEGITFTTQQQIDDFQTNYPGCTEIEGDVEISSWTGINNLNGLNELTSIGGDLWIYSSEALIDLTGLNNVTSIGGELRIADCKSLTSFSGLDNVNSIGGGLSIHNNVSLSSVAALSNLTSIEGDLLIEYNEILTSLEGLQNITQVDGSLKFSNNNNLLDLSGLGNLTLIGGELYLMWNDNLVSLSGIDNIEEASIDSLTIVFNNSLSDCDVQSICNYLVSPNGTIDIGFNSTGCNSIAEVEEACLTGLDEISANKNNIQIFPNPAKKSITLISPSEFKIKEVTIFNPAGQVVLQDILQEETVDISSLQPGLYFVEIITDRGNIRKKLIIK